MDFTSPIVVRTRPAFALGAFGLLLASCSGQGNGENSLDTSLHSDSAAAAKIADLGHGPVAAPDLIAARNIAYRFSDQLGDSIAANGQSGFRVRLTPGGVDILRPGTHFDRAFGFGLASWGADGQLEQAEPVLAAADGCVSSGYAFGEDDCLERQTQTREGIQEWWENTPRGLEHGFVIEQMAGDELELHVAFAQANVRVTSDTRATITPNDQSGTLVYDRLVAWDANGEPLDAWFEASLEGLIIRVDVASAAWPVTVDPVLTPTNSDTESDATAGSELGRTMLMFTHSGTQYVLAGDPTASSGAGEIYLYSNNSGSFQLEKTAIGTTDMGLGMSAALVDLDGDESDDDGMELLIAARGGSTADPMLVMFPDFLDGTDGPLTRWDEMVDNSDVLDEASFGGGKLTGLGFYPLTISDSDVVDDASTEFGSAMLGEHEENNEGGVWVADPGYNGGRGAVFFVELDKNNIPHTTNSNEDWGTSNSFNSVREGSTGARYGSSLAYWNGGNTDSNKLAVGAEGTNLAYLYDIDHGSVAHVTSEEAIGNAANSDEFGASVAFIDLGGVAPTLAIGAPAYDGASTTDEGQVSLYRLTSTSVAASPFLEFSSEVDGAMMGRSLASGDFNDDANPDLAMGAPGYEFTANSEAGGAILLVGAAGSGTTFGFPDDPNEATVSGVSETGLLFLDGSGGVRSGSNLVMGDFNGDSFDDLLMAGWDEGAVSSNGSAMKVVMGQAIDLDADGSNAGTDCNDFNSLVAPGNADTAPNIQADGLTYDYNCDGSAVCFSDGPDNDGHADSTGASTVTESVGFNGGVYDCLANGHAIAEDDCDDNDPLTYTGAVESVGEETDRDCDGQLRCFIDNDGDGFGAGELLAGQPSVTAGGTGECDVANTSSSTGGVNTTDANYDCLDDNSASSSVVYPGADELVGDAYDNDCNGSGVALCYEDNDTDGYAAAGAATTPASVVGGGSTYTCVGGGLAQYSIEDPSDGSYDEDCNDTTADAYPGNTNTVIGDAYDNDCDGEIRCYVDYDGDGYGKSVSGVDQVVAFTFSPPTDSMACTGSNSYAGQIVGGSAVAIGTVDLAGQGGDCHDESDNALGTSAANPGVLVEITGDDYDNDCDGIGKCYIDNDNDTYGAFEFELTSANGANGLFDCNATGFASRGAVSRSANPADFDCNDAVAGVNPGATETIADDYDNNCSGTALCYADADNDGYGRGFAFATVFDAGNNQVFGQFFDCDAELGYSNSGGTSSADSDYDCNDSIFEVNPGATDSTSVVNAYDDDCDGSTICYVDADGDTYGVSDAYVTVAVSAANVGLVDCDVSGSSSRIGDGTSAQDCDDATLDLNGVAVGSYSNSGNTELVGDDHDNDCNGSADCYADTDGDGYGAEGNVISVFALSASERASQPDPSYYFSCSISGGNVAPAPGDCNDKAGEGASVNPDADEIIGNRFDDDCNGYMAFYWDADGDGYGAVPTSADIVSYVTESLLDYDPVYDVTYDDGASSIVEVQVLSAEQWDNIGGSVAAYVVVENMDEQRVDCSVSVTDGGVTVPQEEVCQGLWAFRQPSADAIDDLQFDCHDNFEFANPGIAMEIGGNIYDDDCDGYVDCAQDLDQDGYGGEDTTSLEIGPDIAAEASTGYLRCSGIYAEVGGDCNDADPQVKPNAEGLVQGQAGYINEIVGDNWDNDCDGYAACFNDVDGDGYGSPTSLDTAIPVYGVNGTQSNLGSGYAIVSATIGANTINVGEYDCNDPALATDGVFVAQHSEFDDVLGELTDPNAIHVGDCNDLVDVVNPGATEVIGLTTYSTPQGTFTGGFDDDCSGSATCYRDADGDTYGGVLTREKLVPSGDEGAYEYNCLEPDAIGDEAMANTNDDCHDDNPDANPGVTTETAGNGWDDDCDGFAYCYVDSDNDGYGGSSDGAPILSAAQPIAQGTSDFSCDQPNAGLADDDLDCDDSLFSVNPDQTEQVDATLDEDCNGFISCYFDKDQDTYGADIDELIPVSAVANGFTCDNTANAGQREYGGVYYTDRGGLTTAINPELTQPFYDCHDDNAGANPGQPAEDANLSDIGDQYDQDCNGSALCFEDQDGDGYGAGSIINNSVNDALQSDGSYVRTYTCDDPANDFSERGGLAITDDEYDCHDFLGGGEAAYPGATEATALSSGLPLDNDCGASGDVAQTGRDENIYCWRDLDNDGYGNGRASLGTWATLYSGPRDNTPNVTCNDSSDSDGLSSRGDTFENYQATLLANQSVDNGIPMVNTTFDCHDYIAEFNPGATDTPGHPIGDSSVPVAIQDFAWDQNCDGVVNCWVDTDDDGYGDGIRTDDQGQTVDGAQLIPPDPYNALYQTSFAADSGGLHFGPWSCEGTAAGQSSSEAPLGGYSSSDPNWDCNNDIFGINPGQTEDPSNSWDDDCSGTAECYRDQDGDGWPYADANGVLEITTASAGADYASAACAAIDEDFDLANPIPDCDDRAGVGAFSFPGNATESDEVNGFIGDGYDNDCDGQALCYHDLDLDGYGDLAAAADDSLALGDRFAIITTITDSASDPYFDCDVAAVPRAPRSGDCDDNEANAFPRNVSDGPGYDAAYLEGGNWALGSNSQSGEIADAIDNDCDGMVACWLDEDGDGFGRVQGFYPELVTYNVGSALEIANDTTDLDCDALDVTIPNTSVSTIGDYDDPALGFDCLDEGEYGKLAFPPVLDSTHFEVGSNGVARVVSAPSGQTVDIGVDGLNLDDTSHWTVGNNIDEDCDGVVACWVEFDQDTYAPIEDVGGGTIRSVFDDVGSVTYNSTGVVLVSANGIGTTYAAGDRDICTGAIVEDEVYLAAFAGDCDDANADVNPGESEYPGNDVDENCDAAVECFADMDHDGHGSGMLDADGNWQVVPDFNGDGQCGWTTQDSVYYSMIQSYQTNPSSAEGIIGEAILTEWAAYNDVGVVTPSALAAQIVSAGSLEDFVTPFEANGEFLDCFDGPVRTIPLPEDATSNFGEVYDAVAYGALTVDYDVTDPSEVRPGGNEASDEVAGDGIDGDCAGTFMTDGTYVGGHEWCVQDADGDGYWNLDTATDGSGLERDTVGTADMGSTVSITVGTVDYVIYQEFICEGSAADDGSLFLSKDLDGGNDCNDDPNNFGELAKPGASETWYDGIDSDCDGRSDFDRDGDGFDSLAAVTAYIADPTGPERPACPDLLTATMFEDGTIDPVVGCGLPMVEAGDGGLPYMDCNDDPADQGVAYHPLVGAGDMTRREACDDRDDDCDGSVNTFTQKTLAEVLTDGSFVAGSEELLLESRAAATRTYSLDAFVQVNSALYAADATSSEATADLVDLYPYASTLAELQAAYVAMGLPNQEPTEFPVGYDGDADTYGADQFVDIGATSVKVFFGLCDSSEFGDNNPWVSKLGDCDDADVNTNPASLEICENGKDDDCSDQVDDYVPGKILTADENLCTDVFLDGDGDGYHLDPNAETTDALCVCEATIFDGAGASTVSGGVCESIDPVTGEIRQGVFLNNGSSVECYVQKESLDDFWDCEDNDPDIAPLDPGEPKFEFPDGKDNDCDGRVPVFELDCDGDGKYAMLPENLFFSSGDDIQLDYYSSANEVGLESCSAGGTKEIACYGQRITLSCDEETFFWVFDHTSADAEGYWENFERTNSNLEKGWDCDDHSAIRYEGNTEICDGVDNDCVDHNGISNRFLWGIENGLDEDGIPVSLDETFTVGSVSALELDVDEDGYLSCDGSEPVSGNQTEFTDKNEAPETILVNDCMDYCTLMRPGATDVCNGFVEADGCSTDEAIEMARGIEDGKTAADGTGSNGSRDRYHQCGAYGAAGEAVDGRADGSEEEIYMLVAVDTSNQNGDTSIAPNVLPLVPPRFYPDDYKQGRNDPNPASITTLDGVYVETGTDVGFDKAGKVRECDVEMFDELQNYVDLTDMALYPTVAEKTEYIRNEMLAMCITADACRYQAGLAQANLGESITDDDSDDVSDGFNPIPAADELGEECDGLLEVECTLVELGLSDERDADILHPDFRDQYQSCLGDQDTDDFHPEQGITRTVWNQDRIVEARKLVIDYDCYRITGKWGCADNRPLDGVDSPYIDASASYAIAQAYVTYPTVDARDLRSDERWDIVMNRYFPEVQTGTVMGCWGDPLDQADLDDVPAIGMTGGDCDTLESAGIEVNRGMAEGPFDMLGVYNGLPADCSTCNDGVDNNCDGVMDMDDPGCQPCYTGTLPPGCGGCSAGGTTGSAPAVFLLALLGLGLRRRRD